MPLTSLHSARWNSEVPTGFTLWLESGKFTQIQNLNRHPGRTLSLLVERPHLSGFHSLPFSPWDLVFTCGRYSGSRKGGRWQDGSSAFQLAFDSDCCNGSIPSRRGSSKVCCWRPGTWSFMITLACGLAFPFGNLLWSAPGAPALATLSKPPLPLHSFFFFFKPVFFIGHTYLSIHLSSFIWPPLLKLKSLSRWFTPEVFCPLLPLFPSPSVSTPKPTPMGDTNLYRLEIWGLKFNLLGSDSCSVIY